jgi:hypothetical protein
MAKYLLRERTMTPGARVIKWSCIVYIAALPFAWAYLAFGQTPKDAATLADLKRQMPKDQLAYIEKIDAHKQLQRDTQKEGNDFRRRELQAKLKESSRALEADLTRKLQGDGLKGWVGVYVSGGPSGMDFAVPGYLVIDVSFKGVPDKVKPVLREINDRDWIVVTIQTPPSPEVRVEAGAAANAVTIGGVVRGPSLKAIEKAKRD